jgi:hypothetical protein
MILLIGYYGKLMAIFLIPMGFSFCHAFVTLGLYDRPNPRPLPGAGRGARLRLDKLRLTCIVPPKAARRTVQVCSLGGLLEPPAFGP